jgi:hypothetical protein
MKIMGSDTRRCVRKQGIQRDDTCFSQERTLSAIRALIDACGPDGDVQDDCR